MKQNKCNQSGFTVLEMVIVSSIIFLASTAVFEFVSRQMNLLEVTGTQSDIRVETQLAVTRISNDIRSGTRSGAGSPPNVVITAAPNTSMTFYKPDDIDGNGFIIDGAGDIEWGVTNPIVYWYDEDANQLLRDEGGDSVIIASNVTGVVFADQIVDGLLGDDEIRVTVTIQQTTSLGMTLNESITAITNVRN